MGFGRIDLKRHPVMRSEVLPRIVQGQGFAANLRHPRFGPTWLLN